MRSGGAGAVERGGRLGFGGTSDLTASATLLPPPPALRSSREIRFPGAARRQAAGTGTGWGRGGWSEGTQSESQAPLDALGMGAASQAAPLQTRSRGASFLPTAGAPALQRQAPGPTLPPSSGARDSGASGGVGLHLCLLYPAPHITGAEAGVQFRPASPTPQPQSGDWDRLQPCSSPPPMCPLSPSSSRSPTF